MSASTDFVVMFPDGRVIHGQRQPGETMSETIRGHILDLGTQSLGDDLRMWFADTFTFDMPRNPTADRVIGRLGYEHQDGWYGPVGVSMEEDWDGQIPPLTAEVLAVITEITNEDTTHGLH
jgi:hypothetical protein